MVFGCGVAGTAPVPQAEKMAVLHFEPVLGMADAELNESAPDDGEQETDQSLTVWSVELDAIDCKRAL
jgi:hypothetical protein